MANLLSSKKRIRQNEKHRLINRARKSQIKTEVRKFDDALHDGDLQLAEDQFQVVTKILDQTAAKSTMHRNTASRRKSRLARPQTDDDDTEASQRQ